MSRADILLKLNQGKCYYSLAGIVMAIKPVCETRLIIKLDGHL